MARPYRRAGAIVLESAALSRIVDLTAPHMADMITVLVRLAKTSRRDALRERAAGKLIEIHLAAAGQQRDENAKLGGQVVVIRSQTLDEVEALQSGAPALTLAESAE